MAGRPECEWWNYLHDDIAVREVCNRPAVVKFIFNQGRPGEFAGYRCAEHAERLRQQYQGRNVPETPVEKA